MVALFHTVHGALCLVAAGWMIWRAIRGYGLVGPAGVEVLAAGMSALVGWILLAMGIVLWLIGRGLKGQSQVARAAATVPAVLGLFSVPVGTMINGAMLWVLYGEHGKIAFSQRYRDAKAATPHIRARTPMLARLVAAAYVFVTGGVLVGMWMLLASMAASV